MIDLALKEQIPTRKVNLDQVWIQKWESKLVQKWGPNQKIDVHTRIQFHGVLVQDSILTPKYGKKIW